MDKFRFDEKEHRYYFGELEIPGISAVIKVLAGDPFAKMPQGRLLAWMNIDGTYGGISPIYSDYMAKKGKGQLFEKDWILGRAADYGDAVHGLIELIEKKTLDPASVGPVLKSAKEKWERLKEEEGLEMMGVEKPLGSKRWGYGGREDWFGKNKHHENILIEIKTTVEISATVKIQTAAQAQLIKENCGLEIDRRFVFQILPNTPFSKPEEFDDSMDFKFFLAGLTCWKFRKKENLL